MIHITQSKLGFEVAVIGSNRKVLNVTNQGFANKQKVWINIYAQAKEFGADTVNDYDELTFYVQDDTRRTRPVIWEVYYDWNASRFIRNLTKASPDPKYIPGKNPKRKPKTKKELWKKRQKKTRNNPNK